MVVFAEQQVPLWLTYTNSKQCFANPGGWEAYVSAAAVGAQVIAEHAAGGVPSSGGGAASTLPSHCNANASATCVARSSIHIFLTALAVEAGEARAI